MLRVLSTASRGVIHKHSSLCTPIRAFSVESLPSLVKIVATIGPASEQMPMLQHMVTAGMRVMRVNFSHATFEEADLRMSNLKASIGLSRKAFPISSEFNLRAVMLDTQGPEIRTGSFHGVKEIELCSDDVVILTTKDEARNHQTSSLIWISYSDLVRTVKHGSAILLDDGAIELRVESISGDEVTCRVTNTGVLGNKKGVNIPGHKLTLPAMSEKDKIDFQWGVRNDVDYIAASFVRRPSDVVDIRQYISGLMREQGFPVDYPLPLIISKIESTEALDNLDDLIDISDGIMIARGDLGVEIPMENLTNWQKEIVRRCNIAGKPVIVATQMLESMQKNPRPTRAECTDVANAVLDGADCVMLSGESAKGKYPVGSVSMMRKLIDQSEMWLKSHKHQLLRKSSCDDVSEGMALAAVEAARMLKAKCIIVRCHTGKTAKDVAKYRPNIPVVAFTQTSKVARLLQMYRGVHPSVLPVDSPSDDPVEVEIMRTKTLGFCEAGDLVIFMTALKGHGVLGESVSMRAIEVK